MSLKPVVRVRQLGRLAFAEAYGIQTQTAEALRREILAKPAVLRRNTLLLVEHEPVFTVGIRSKGYTSEDESRLRKLGADFVRTNRGGLITFHGPGQLVAYPILYLGSFNEQKSMRWYVCQLEKTVVDTCAHFGLRADTTQETGVWIGDNKIAAIGNAPTHSGNRRNGRKWFY
uniref:lipoyl(octanoyl) transferase n=1 Tax=Ixodes ricinus TaxID=34613 RepID=A0A0K8R3B5_IXORI